MLEHGQRTALLLSLASLDFPLTLSYLSIHSLLFVHSFSYQPLFTRYSLFSLSPLSSAIAWHV
jgi:hypothetical protein